MDSLAAAAGGGSSSKVTVEYSDPSGIFSLVSPQIQARLPFRSLNWHSPPRPARSIDSLYIELVPDEDSSDSSSLRSPGDGGLSRVGTPVGLPSGTSTPASARRERRHQIPGLHQSPYLRLFLLRCEDVDTYKATARKKVREWLKTHTSPSTGSSTSRGPETHDAFEWMILHVVITPDSEPSTAPTKATSNLLDKIRSDFNISSKPVMDRVAQVFIRADSINKPVDSLKRNADIEAQRSWDDFITKSKALILASFDQRVRQYEDDIRQKNSQRSLPGWNFCTYFVLKEGLARGFENVSLLEDALVGYDELAAELLMALRDQADRAAVDEDTSMLREHTRELREFVQTSLVTGKDASQSNQAATIPVLLDLDHKPFRELILANDISAFDFRCYVFARQTQLLLRIATSATKTGNAQIRSNNQSLDAAVAAEVCHRAVSFIAAAGRLIRADLTSMDSRTDVGEAVRRSRYTVIENTISCWTFASARRALAVTGDIAPFARKAADGAGAPMLRLAPKSAPSLDSEVIEALVDMEPSPSPGVPVTSAVMMLMAQKAELYVTARRALVGAAARHGWRIGWLEEPVKVEELDDVSIDQAPADAQRTDGKSDKRSDPVAPSAGIFDPTMRSALASEKAFWNAYEALSRSAFLYFESSGDRKASQTILAEIALVRCRLEDYETAAFCFRQLAPLLSRSEWTELQAAVLRMYAMCLRKLDRTEEYVRIALQVLSIAAHSSSLRSHLSKSGGGIANDFVSHGPVDLAEIVRTSQSLEQPVAVPLKEYFPSFKVEPYLHHTQHGDAFQLRCTFTSAFPTTVEAETLQVKLSTIDQEAGPEIALHSIATSQIQQGSNAIVVESRMLLCGEYAVHYVALRIKNIIFEHRSLSSPSSAQIEPSSQDNIKAESPRILLWPPGQAVDLTACSDYDIDLEQPRFIRVTIQTRGHALLRAELRIRAASAGLRIRTAEVASLNEGVHIDATTGPGLITIGSVAEQSTVELRIPYQQETETREVWVRTTLSYQPSDGTSQIVLGDRHRIPVFLPLGVNVQDLFTRDALFSKFSVSSASHVPLRVSQCSLKASEIFEVQQPMTSIEGSVVFAQQPLSLMYRVLPKTLLSSLGGDRKLYMDVRYACLDDEVLHTIGTSLRAALADDFSDYTELLVRHVHRNTQQTLAAMDWDSIGLLHEVQLPSTAEFGWPGVLQNVPLMHRSALAARLAQWHLENSTLPLSTSSSIPTRRITIPVDVPTTPVVQTVCLRLLRNASDPPPAVGDVLAAELSLTHTRAWGSQDTVSAGLTAPGVRAAPRPWRFVYDILPAPESWLLGGSRRAAFEALPDRTTRFPLLLIPQRPGTLILPGVDVRFAGPAPGAIGTHPSGAPAISDNDRDIVAQGVQVDLRSQATSITVVSGRTGVAVALNTHHANRKDQSSVAGSASGSGMAAAGSQHLATQTQWQVVGEERRAVQGVPVNS